MKRFLLSFLFILSLSLNSKNSTSDLNALRIDSIANKKIEPNQLLTYKSINGVDLKLHVFYPLKHHSSHKKPAIIFFFGGGWASGTPEQFYEQADYFSKKGMVAISAEYRVKNRNQTTPFESVKDAKSAVRWVRQHANELGINPENIIASGGSAGGHIAACTGVINGFEEAGEDTNISSIPNGMILFNPVLDTTAKGYGIKKVGEAKQTEISPCHHIRKGIVPTLVFHGTADKTVPFENAQRFTNLMKQAGNQCKLVAFEGKEHGFFNGSYFRPKIKNTNAYKQTIEDSEKFLTSLGFLKNETSQTKAQKPNIILLMTDDQGWGDVGYNDHPHLKTPNLDAMAANGAVFDRFYAASAVCSPTRGSVMTGRHPMRYGICYANCGHIKKEEITLAEMVKECGYTTGHFGKWHLGTLTRDILDANRGGQPKYDNDYAPPWDNGFDVSFVTESKVPTYNPMITPSATSGDVNDKLIEGKPFNTYYWTGPNQIETENLEGDDSRVIMDRVIPFINNAVQSKQPFLSVVWFHTPHLPVIAGKDYQQIYAGLSKDQQHYYGVLSALDDQIGRLRNELRKLGIEDNTIILYTSDNGPEGKSVKGRTQGLTKGLKGRKRSLYEGGIRVPGIIEWPSKIKPNTKVSTPCYTSDYFPTIAAILDLDLKKYNRPFDGIDILPFTLNNNLKRNAPLVFSIEEQAALIDNDYKIYRKNPNSPFELYNILNDAQEQNNLAKQQPEKLAELESIWKTWDKSREASAQGKDY